MKKLALMLCALCTMFLLAGCGGTAISGSYEDAAGNLYEFETDSFYIYNKDDAAAGLSGAYTCDSETGTLTFTSAIPGGTTVERKATYTLDKETGTLTITGEDGKVSTLTKK